MAIPWIWKQEQFDTNVETKTFYKDWDGDYRDDRLALHHDIVSGWVRGHKSQVTPSLALISGGAASGKSSAADQAMKDLPDAILINTDEIRRQLPEFKYIVGTDRAGLLQEEAGDIRNKLLAEATALRLNMVLDAPGSPAVATLLDEIESHGYSISIVYTHKPVAQAKVAAAYRARNAKNPADRRVVPDSVIEDSHRKARHGLNAMALRKNRDLKVCDKTDAKIGDPALVIYHRTAGGKVIVNDPPRMKKFTEDDEPHVTL